jgi:hypothetical protein
MTPEKWDRCTDLEKMLGSVLYVTGMTSDRKQRLFAAACCRRVWHLLTDPRSREAVEAQERFADGLVTARDLAAAESAAKDAWVAARAALAGTDYPSADAFTAWASKPGDGTRELSDYPALAAQISAAGAATGAWAGAASAAAWAAVPASVWATADSATGRAAWEAARDAESVAQCRLLRDILGNPFRPAEIDPRWLDWRRGRVWRLAQALYRERAFDRLPVLADALQGAGCCDADLLGHLRGPGPHALGCHALDAALGKW